MQPRPSFDRTFLIPIAIGVVSILGMGWIFLTRDLGKSRLPVTATPFSASPFKPWTLTPKAQTPSTAAETGPLAYPGPFAETLPSPSPSITESPVTPSATPTPENIQPLLAG